MPYLYIWGCDDTQKTLEVLPAQVDLGNGGKDEDGTDNNKRENIVHAHHHRK